MAPLRPGRSGEAGGRNSPGEAGEERRAITWPTGAGEPAELPSWYPRLQSPLQATWVPGGIGGRLGRSGEVCGRGPLGEAGEERRVIAPPTQARGTCRAPRLVPCPPRAPHPHPTPACRIGPLGIGGRPGRSGEAGGRGPPRPEEQERRGGRLPRQLEPRKPAGLPGEVPCPLRPGVEGTPGPLLFLEPKPHPSQPPGPFPALWS